MTLVIVRHGETALNAARMLQPADTPLSARGLAQAAAVAQRIAALAPAAVLSSDQPRAVQTAEVIARAAGGLALQTTPLLQERNFGALRGLPYDTLGFDPLRMAEAPPGGESLAQFEARVAQAFAFVLQQRAALRGALVVVTHGLVVRALLAAHLAPGQRMPQHIGNTSLTIAAAAPPHAVELLNCTQHLPDADAHGLSGG